MLKVATHGERNKFCKGKYTCPWPLTSSAHKMLGVVKKKGVRKLRWKSSSWHHGVYVSHRLPRHPAVISAGSASSSRGITNPVGPHRTCLGHGGGCHIAKPSPCWCRTPASAWCSGPWFLCGPECVPQGQRSDGSRGQVDYGKEIVTTDPGPYPSGGDNCIPPDDPGSTNDDDDCNSSWQTSRSRARLTPASDHIGCTTSGDGDGAKQ